MFLNTKLTERRLLLWCSPGFGLIDIWLPIIQKLKNKYNVKIDFVFPEPSSLRFSDKKSDSFNLAAHYSDNIIYRGYSGRWFIASTLVEARNSIKFSKFDKQIAHFSRRLTKGNISNFFLLKKLGKLTSKLSKRFIYVKEDFGRLNSFDFGLLDKVDGILCDITMEDKPINKDLKNKLKNIYKFSMSHGLAPTWAMDNFMCKKPVATRSDVFVYIMSKIETTGYEKCFGILEKNFFHVGIPRHDKVWIDFIYKQSSSAEEKIFNSYVLIIGRSSSTFNTLDRRKKALKDIYDIICVKHKLKLVIKAHPSESLNGIDGDIYNEVFGKGNYGEKWIYSKKHALVLGNNAVFCISFYSGVVLDMLAIKKPTIEYLDLRGLDLYDNSSSLRDESGNPVFMYRYTKLVLGVSSRVELERYVDYVLNKFDTTLLSLYSMYEKYFMPFDGASEIAADNIYKQISNKNFKNI